MCFNLLYIRGRNHQVKCSLLCFSLPSTLWYVFTSCMFSWGYGDWFRSYHSAALLGLIIPHLDAKDRWLTATCHPGVPATEGTSWFCLFCFHSRSTIETHLRSSLNFSSTIFSELQNKSTTDVDILLLAIHI